MTAGLTVLSTAVTVPASPDGYTERRESLIARLDLNHDAYRTRMDYPARAKPDVRGFGHHHVSCCVPVAGYLADCFRHSSDGH
jgi:hypothetical protein